MYEMQLVLPPEVINLIKQEADTITRQFNTVLEEYYADKSEDKNWVVFITHKGLSLLDFDHGLLSEASLIIDEVPDAFQNSYLTLTVDDLEQYLNYFDTSVREFDNYYIVTLDGFNQLGNSFFYTESSKISLPLSTIGHL